MVQNKKTDHSHPPILNAPLLYALYRLELCQSPFVFFAGAMTGTALQKSAVRVALALTVMGWPTLQADRNLPALPNAEAVMGNAPADQAHGPMTVQAAIARARAVSPELATARLEVDRMMARLFGIRIKYYPEFQVQLQAPRVFDYNAREEGLNESKFQYRTTEPGFEASLKQKLPSNTELSADYNHDISRAGLLSDRLSLVFSQEFVRKDPLWLQESLAEKQIWLKKTAQASVDREFEYRVKNTFYSVLEAELIAANAERRYEQDEKFAAESEDKFRSGVIAEYSLLDYQRDLKVSESRLVARKASLDLARSEFASLLQIPYGAPVSLVEPSDPVINGSLFDPRRMVESGMRHELRIAQVRYNMLANAENADYIRNTLLPSVRFEARGDLYRTIGDGVFNTSQPVEGRDLSAALLVTFPLFGSTFEKWNNLRLEEIDRSINENQIDSLFRQEVRDVRNALISLNEIQARHSVAKDIEKLAAREFEISRLRFELGSVGSFDVIRSKNEYFNALDELTTLRYALLRRLAEIERDYPPESMNPGLALLK